MTGRARILDLYCCAGGAARGYADAGFEVVGVDIELQPRYPFCFEQGDALEVLRRLLAGGAVAGYRLEDFGAVHASPPCQSFTSYRRRGAGVGDGYPNLIGPTRELLVELGLPYVIENVEGARSRLRAPVMLCGSSFGLDIRRHRLFECSFPLLAPSCDHSWQTPRFPAASNRGRSSRRTVEIGVWRIPLAVQQQAMGGCDWMTLRELSQAIPPAFTEHIGGFLMAAVRDRLEARDAA